jgi:hypothetical protein
VDRWSQFNDVLIDSARSTDDVQAIDATRPVDEVESDVRDWVLARLQVAPNLINDSAVEVPARASDDHAVPIGRGARTTTVGAYRPVDVLKAMVEMLASGDPSGAAGVIAEDYLDHQGLGAGPVHGVDGFARVVRANYASLEDQQIVLEDLFGVEDRAVARIRWSGTRHSGGRIDRQTIDIIRVSNGLPVEHWGART